MPISFDSVLSLSELSDFESARLTFGKRAVRCHAKRGSRKLPFPATPVPWYPYGHFLEDAELRPSTFLQHAIGDYYIQDAASLLPLGLIDVSNGPWVCDLCAAPGGKASAIAERLGLGGFLLANETVQSRVDVLKYALARTGTPNYAVSKLDPVKLAECLPSFFDIVLVDAPCSGQTLVGRDKRSENAFSENQILHCALRQSRILTSAIRLLKPGGQLIYSTCTFAIEENEDQIQSLFDRFPEAWQPIEPNELSRWKSPRTPGCYRLWPHRDHCAGGFAAGLQLIQDIEIEDDARTDANPVRSKKASSRFATERKEHWKQAKALQSSAQQFLDELGSTCDLHLAMDGKKLVARTEVHQSKIEKLEMLNVDYQPLLITNGSHLIPTQGLAMLSPVLFQPKHMMELSDLDAKTILQGQSLSRSSTAIGPVHGPVHGPANGPANGPVNGSVNELSEPIASGWVLARWNGSGLGWLKGIDKRYNNHLPPWARSTLS